MSVITFQCFACNQVLQVGAENAGRKAKCSQCGTILTIPVLAAGGVAQAVLPAASAPNPPPAPPPAPGPRRADDVNVADDGSPRRRRVADEDESAPRRRRDEDYDVRRPAYSKWDKIRIGFVLVFIALCVIAGAYGVELMGHLIRLIAYVSSAVGGFAIASVFIRIGLTVALVATIAAIVGHVFLLFVSNRTGALGFGIAALAICSVYLIFNLVGRTMPEYGALSRNRVLAMLADLLGATYFMMIGFYVRALGRQLDRTYVQGRGMLLVVLSSIMAGYELLTGIILLLASGISGGMVIFWIFFWLGAILTIAVLVVALLAVYEGKRVVDREAATTMY